MNQPPPQGPQQPQICPRCESNNTKFCYFNNCSLSQPRYRCKTCKRHWTLGGTLRNVPVGGGSRKTKQTSTRNSPSSSSPGLIDMPSSHIPPTSYSSGWFSSSLQPFNQVGNIVNESGVSSFGMFQQEQPRHLHQQQQGIVDNSMFQPSWSSTSSQSVNPQGPYWGSSSTNNMINNNMTNNNNVAVSNGGVGGMSSLNNQWSTSDQNGGSGLPPLPQFSSYFSPPF